MRLLLTIILATAANLSAEIQEKTITYKDGKTELEGFFAHDPEVEQTGKAVLIVHQWTGLGDNEKMRARMLAKLGYKAFALDIYGKGIRPQPPAAGKFAGKYKGDRRLYRQRLELGLTQLKSLSKLSDKDIAAIGYCFGGTGVLEIARSGTPLAGIVSFHGGLGAAEGMSAKKESLKSKLLVLHGADDPYVPAKEVAAFKEEIKTANGEMKFIAYPGAVHAFTQTGAGNDNSKGAAYNADADKKSWNAMQEFFKTIFATP
jgi:dienelactone hydrolase